MSLAGVVMLAAGEEVGLSSMGPAVIISLIALVFTTLVALLTVTFKSAAVVTRLVTLEKDFGNAISEVKQMRDQLSALRDQLAKIGTLERALDELKGHIASLASNHGKLTTEIALLHQAQQTLNAQINSVKAMRRVSPSKPDLGG